MLLLPSAVAVKSMGALGSLLGLHPGAESATNTGAALLACVA
jgi:hypothetical protein